MNKRQLLFLFLYCLIPYTVGNGLLPLLPVNAARLGASSSVAGAYLSFTYLALTLGTLAAGWISDHLQSRKRALMLASIVGAPLVWLTGQVVNLWQLTIVNAILYFMGGLCIALANILAGLFAGAGERGKVFGVLALASPVGFLIGGLTAGPIADSWGYPAMFTAFALFDIVCPVIALFIQDRRTTTTRRASDAITVDKPALGWGFRLLFLASLLTWVGSFVSVLGRSLVMKDAGFSATAISSTGAAGAVVAIPLSILSGALSDRIGRRSLLAFGFLAAASGLGLLAVSVSLWHYWLAILLMNAQGVINTAVGSALVADLLPRRSLGRGISFYTATSWIGGVIGFGITGFAIQYLGYPFTFLLAALLPLASVALLIPLRAIRSPAANPAS